MRRCGLIILTLVLVVSLIGCSKKQQALEELQQPMSPEDLNRLRTETASESTSPQVAGGATVVPAFGEKLEPLPPSGPYRPTAKEIQMALKNAGYYNGAIDGNIGPMTKKAIEEFQKTNGLVADGKVGPKTWSILAKHLNPVPTAVPPTAE
jgi:peptidoglycan hydrolase-like protein with peptidoglycan-binding domain